MSQRPSSWQGFSLTRSSAGITIFSKLETVIPTITLMPWTTLTATTIPRMTSGLWDLHHPFLQALVAQLKIPSLHGSLEARHWLDNPTLKQWMYNRPLPHIWLYCYRMRPFFQRCIEYETWSNNCEKRYPIAQPMAALLLRNRIRQ